jgi:hypothetical protein
MQSQAEQWFDIDLQRVDIQGLNSADAIAAFFAQLRYHTETRTTQTAGNLGIAADTTARPIKKIDLIADQEGLFQVYLFELQSITVGHTRALARAFRNRAGNYLLVLTTGDYQRLDFVFLERELPTAPRNEPLLSDKQSAIRPRILTVERRNPTTIQLRVLRRLTWTESDPYYQYEKLRAAYDLATWSEDYFNNRALFSDYYLKERLKEFPVWKEDPKPVYLKLREIYQGAASRFGGQNKQDLYRDLIHPAIDILGFVARAENGNQNAATEAHYTLHSPQNLGFGTCRLPGLPVGSLVRRKGRSARRRNTRRKSRRRCGQPFGERQEQLDRSYERPALAPLLAARPTITRSTSTKSFPNPVRTRRRSTSPSATFGFCSAARRSSLKRSIVRARNKVFRCSISSCSTARTMPKT